MRILAFNGSPKRRRSNTARLLRPMLEAARHEGAEVEELYVNDLDVGPCRGCMSCWLATPGRCVQEDDMPGVLAKMLAADVLVLGFPLYIFGVPARVQALLERILPMAEPWLIRADGVTHHPLRHEGRWPNWVVICNAGFPEQSVFDALVRKFARMRTEPIVMGAGEFLRFMQLSPELAEPLAALREALAEAGRALARTGAIPGELRARLSRPVIEWAGVSADDYARMGNESFAEALKRRGHDATRPAGG